MRYFPSFVVVVVLFLVVFLFVKSFLAKILAKNDRLFKAFFCRYFKVVYSSRAKKSFNTP